MNKTQLEMDGLIIEIIRKPIKNMHLRIYPPDGQVKVSAPLRLRLDLIRSQLETKRSWIHAQRARFLTQTLQTPIQLESGEQHHFLGKAYRLLITETNGPQTIHLDNEIMHLFIKSNPSLVEKQQVMACWYRQQMREQLPPLIAKWEPIMGVKVDSWGIRAMKTRWGSCNTRAKRISLNLTLIKKNLCCLEYVLVHEMVHLLEASHNKRFYALMDRFLPPWREYQYELEARKSHAK